MTREHRLPKTACPVCDAELDAATNADAADIAPRPGDVTACLYCGHILTFTDALTLRDLSVFEIAALPSDTRMQLMRAQRLIRQVRQ